MKSETGQASEGFVFHCTPFVELHWKGGGQENAGFG